MLKILAALVLQLFAAVSVAAAPAANATPAGTIAVVYLGAYDCFYCQHWEARAKGELLRELQASTEGKAVRFYEIMGETLRKPIVERHFPPELKWLARTLGPTRGVPRFLLLLDGKVEWSVYGTNDYETVFLPALRQAVARRTAVH